MKQFRDMNTMEKYAPFHTPSILHGVLVGAGSHLRDYCGWTSNEHAYQMGMKNFSIVFSHSLTGIKKTPNNLPKASQCYYTSSFHKVL